MRHESGDKLTKCTHSYYSLINDRSQGCQYLLEDMVKRISRLVVVVVFLLTTS